MDFRLRVDQMQLENRRFKLKIAVVFKPLCTSDLTNYFAIFLIRLQNNNPNSLNELIKHSLTFGNPIFIHRANEMHFKSQIILNLL